jgi:hypothetical protein
MGHASFFAAHYSLPAIPSIVIFSRILCHRRTRVQIFAPLESIGYRLFCILLHFFVSEILPTLLESVHSALFAKNRGCRGTPTRLYPNRSWRFLGSLTKKANPLQRDPQHSLQRTFAVGSMKKINLERLPDNLPDSVEQDITV